MVGMMDKHEKREYEQRLERLQDRMRQAGIDLFLVTQNVDIYYLTGSMQAGYLAVPGAGEAIYYIRRSLTRAEEESAATVAPIGSFRAFGERLSADFPDIFRASGMPVIATECDVLPAAQLQRLQAVVTGADWQDGSTIIRELRMIKSGYEIAKIKSAAEAVNAAFQNIAAYIRPGMPEYELIARIEFDLRMQGHLGFMRMRAYNQEIITGVVGAGEAISKSTYFDGPGGGTGLSAASPQGAGRRLLRADEPILVDIGCCMDGYVIDQTRTIAMNSVPAPLQSAYDHAVRILRETETRMKPGADCGDLYEQAVRMAADAGLSKHFMGYDADQVKFLGHGIGLEVDELPVLTKGFRTPLQAGMVVAVEPKFTFPELGMVGIENCYAITSTGWERLTISDEALIIL